MKKLVLFLLVALAGCATFKNPTVIQTAQTALAVLAIEEPAVREEVCFVLHNQYVPNDLVNAAMSTIHLTEKQKKIAQVVLAVVEAEVHQAVSGVEQYDAFVAKICH